MIGRRILVSGKVQGVFYRGWCVTTGRVLGLSGWVRNLASGEVEIKVWGPPAAVETFIERCREGPPAAIVKDLEISDVAPELSTGFEVHHTS